MSEPGSLNHPWHLHGFAFRTLDFGVFSAERNLSKLRADLQAGVLARASHRPTAKDTMAVPSAGYGVIRFRADNPGKHTRWNTELTRLNPLATRLAGWYININVRVVELKMFIVCYTYRRFRKITSFYAVGVLPGSPKLTEEYSVQTFWDASNFLIASIEGNPVWDKVDETWGWPWTYIYMYILPRV